MLVRTLAFLCLLTTFQLRSASAQTVVTMTEVFTVETYDAVEGFVLEGFIPQTLLNRQRVIDVRFSDNRIKKVVRAGIDYYKLETNDYVTEPIRIEFDIQLYDYDLSVARSLSKKPESSDDENLQAYLVGGPFQRVNNKRILRAAEKIDGATELEMVENIFNFVVDRLEYFNEDFFEDVGPVTALKEGRGDCTEYADLMVTLCRVKGIPARVVSGMIAKTDNNPTHNWCEVYLSEYGWVPFDPTFADGGKDTRFDKLPRHYIYYSRERIDPKLRGWCVRWTWESGVSGFDLNFEANWDINSAATRAYGFYNDQEYDSALGLLDALLEIDSHNIDFITFKGMILARLGLFDEAHQLFQVAITTAEHYYEKMNTYYSFANFLSLKGDYAAASKYLFHAFDFGFDNIEHLKIDEDLEGFRNSELYESFLAGLAKR